MLKLLVEFGPIVVFFATYKFSDIFQATILMLLVTLLGLVVSYLIDKKISIPLLISGGVLLSTGSITIFSGDPSFIKMKPTIVFGIFSLILFFGVLRNQGLVKYVLGTAIQMEERAWKSLSIRFASYLLFSALLNEYIWRNYSESFWVNFKVFGFAPMTLIFVALQIPFLLRNQKNNIL
ncbi:MAG: septation protein A [Alphaproteobacteria bacterium]|nr:septation protein A [Alphaproteobacteria bacterium]